MTNALMLRASEDVISEAKQEILRRDQNFLELANEINISPQLIENFLNGEIIDRNTYELVCHSLNINSSDSQIKSSTEAIAPTVSVIQEAVNRAVAQQHQSMDSELHSSATTPEENIALLSLSDSSKSQNGLASLSIAEQSNQITNQITVDQLTKAIHIDPQISSRNSQIEALDINQYLQSIHQTIALNLIRQCDRLRVMDINYPLSLQDLYVEAHLFISLTSGQYLDLHEALENVSPEQYDRFYLGKLKPASIAATQALESHSHILLVGGLGSGKTTLLKQWAISCINQEILPDHLPILLSLRSLVTLDKQSINNSSPLIWLQSQIANYGLSNKVANELLNYGILERLLTEGKLLLLWDGIDEIPESYREAVLTQIANFSDRYAQSRMVVATRNPNYTNLFESFHALEITPLQEREIFAFASKWFHLTCPQKPKKLENFQQLLSANQPLAEVATNPLLLTHICNLFNNYEQLKPNFYQEIINLFLFKWEESKCLTKVNQQFEQQSLTANQKLDLLSYMAIFALDRHGYVWQNNELDHDFQACVTTSKALSNFAGDRDRLFYALKYQHGLIVECARGVHRLSYITLHDYLAAYRMSISDLNAVQKYLLERLYLKRWYGVIVMTVSISQQADLMLKKMKQKIDSLVAQDPHLQAFLAWVNQQSIQIKTPYKSATVRALYLDIDLENNRSLDRARALDIAHSRSLERARMKSMGIDNSMETAVDIDYTINLALNLDLALYFANHPILELACTLEPDLHRGLQHLRQKFPDPYANRSKFAKWWQAKGLDWAKKLRNLIVHHRKGSQEWKFSGQQLKVLRIYHDANKLLIECLNNAEYASPLVKDQIESTLLLPSAQT